KINEFTKISNDIISVIENYKNPNLNEFRIEDEIEEINDRLNVSKNLKDTYIELLPLIIKLIEPNKNYIDNLKTITSSGTLDVLLAEEIEEVLDSKNITPSISEKALRYDLTVPFARYVVQHQNEI